MNQTNKEKQRELIEKYNKSKSKTNKKNLYREIISLDLKIEKSMSKN